MNTPVKKQSPHEWPHSHAPRALGAFHRTLCCSALAGFVLLAIGTASAQNAVEKQSAEKEAIVQLDPFTVTSENDNGWIASTSLAGGRIATALKDTPVAYSVVTSEFLEAFNLTDVSQAATWTVNSSRDVADGTTFVFGATTTSTLKLRGTPVGNPTRNFFPYVVTPDSFNLDRVDFARGPNAVLFGAGGIGGTLNSVTKQAIIGKAIKSVRFSAGSWNHFRFTGDVNESTADKKAAVRVNIMRDTTDTWRQNEWSEKTGASIAAKYNFTPKLSLRLEGEITKRKEAKALTAMRDQLSSWDGATTFNGIPAVALTQAQRATDGLAGPNNMRWVQNTAFPSATLLNFGNLYTTEAIGQSNTLANTGRINGVPIITPGFNLNRTAVVDDYAGIPADRWAAALRGSSFFTVPTREQTPLWSSKVPTYEEEGKDLAAYLNYQLGDHLFFELAGDMNKGNKIGNTAPRRGLEDLYIDLNQTLPNGAANPNFLHPYTEFMEYRNIRNDDVKNVRLQTVYSRDFNKAWFNGRVNFSLMGGINIERNESRAKTLLLPLTSSIVGTGTTAKTYTNADARTWVDNDEYSQFGVYTRLYLDQANKNYKPADETPFSIKNPVTGATESITPKWMYDTRRVDNNRDSLRKYKFFQTAGNLDLYKNKLVLIGAFRRDFTYLYDNRVMVPGDMPVGWDGTTLKFRPNAPDDYFNLKYIPKNASGAPTGTKLVATSVPRTRDATGAQIRQAQYAKDRFQDDYNSPALSSDVNTFTIGTVFNIKPWLGLYVNKSRTFSLTAPQQQVDGSLSPSTASEGKDFGLRVTLPNGRLSVSLGRFTSDQNLESFNTTNGGLPNGNFKDFYNAIYAAPVLGDLSPTGRNAYDIPAFPDNVYTTRTRHVEGYELELTANLTPDWRLILNAGRTIALATNNAPDIRAYFAQQDPVIRKILADAGVVIDTNNDAKINPLYDTPTQINQTRVANAVTNFNNLQDLFIPGVVAGPINITGTSLWVGNFASDYRFSSSILKGLRVGLGVNYRSPMILGYRGSDTILDPADPTKAIDDPTVDATTPIYSPKQWTTTGSLSYTFQLKDKRTLQLDLNIDNLLNNQEVIYTTSFSGQSNTYVRPRTTISSPARVTVPGAFSYQAPRSYTLSAKLNF